MLTLLIATAFLVAVIGTVAVVGLGGATLELGKLLFFFAIVLMLVSAVVGVARGKMRA